MAGKYMETPGGLYPLGYFLGQALPGVRPGERFAAERVRQWIRRLIAGETPEAPLTDGALAARLREEGVALARRTVAKHRAAMGFPPAAARRRRRAAGHAGRSARPAAKPA